MACRPGITGAATLAFRKEEEFLSEIPEDQLEIFYETFVKPAKAQLDLDYMREATLLSDLAIVWRTATSCLFSTGDSIRETVAESIARSEAVRLLSKKHPQPASQNAAHRGYAPALNQELASVNQEV